MVLDGTEEAELIISDGSEIGEEVGNESGHHQGYQG